MSVILLEAVKEQQVIIETQQNLIESIVLELQKLKAEFEAVKAAIGATGK
jgi:hypothetical protein